MHNDSPIVGSIISLARELGMGIIAEGVETDQQAKQLIALDCPHAQGYLFSRPLAVSGRARVPDEAAGGSGSEQAVRSPRKH